MPISSRDTILSSLRAARRPFPNAAPRPDAYIAVTMQDATDPDALLERFSRELAGLTGEVFPVLGDAAACAKVIELIQSHHAPRILAWDFRHIPVQGLESALREASVQVLCPDTQDEFRAETLALAETAKVGLTGADAAVATTATLVVTTGPGKGRLPTILPPVHIAVITLDQIVARLEDWVALQRAAGLASIRRAGNFCFISGPSRTGDIEMQLVLGVHGPGRVQVVVKR
ncbi:MAG TPA: lactate utilization protein [Candidatus Limnocylindrales bacterium]|nr:lactate utilization protein [Candidatus Limnocylindrales bacterium]